MLKFIHAADIHLDSPLRGLSRYESAPVDALRNACRRALENLVDLAIEEKVPFVLLAGDLYDGDWKDYSTGIFLNRQLGRLGRHDIRVFVVTGNHDAANRITKSLETPANMHLFSARAVETVSLRDIGVTIHGRSFETQHVDENMATGFPDATKGMFNIGLLHTSLDGREGHATYAPCSVDDLCSKGYDYWALGHIHQHEVVARDPWIVFPGCIQGRHIRETGVKGCVLVTVEEGAVVAVEQHALDVFRWAERRINLVDVVKAHEVFERVRQCIEEENASSAGLPVAMRIRFEGATAIADEMAAFPERFEQGIRALGAELAGDTVWIERIENATSGKIDLLSVLLDDSPFGKLLQDIVDTSNDPDSLAGLKEIIADLRQKMPVEAFGIDTLLNISDTTTIVRLIEEAKHLLVGRLLTPGGDG